MVFVALAALDFAVFRAALDDSPKTGGHLAWGTMPMAIVLAIGLFIGYRHHGSRPFLLGFESFGVMAGPLSSWCLAFGIEAVDPYV